MSDHVFRWIFWFSDGLHDGCVICCGLDNWSRMAAAQAQQQQQAAQQQFMGLLGMGQPMMGMPGQPPMMSMPGPSLLGPKASPIVKWGTCDLT